MKIKDVKDVCISCFVAGTLKSNGNDYLRVNVYFLFFQSFITSYDCEVLKMNTALNISAENPYLSCLITMLCNQQEIQPNYSSEAEICVIKR